MNIYNKKNKLWCSVFFCFFLFGCKAQVGKIGSASKGGGTTVPTISSGGSIHVTGTLKYAFVSAATAKLDYANTTLNYMRQVYVELLNAANDSVISSTSTDDLGAYDFAISNNGNIKLRIYAEIKSPSVIVQDNTNGDAQYTLLTSSYTINGNTVVNVTAPSGWTGSNAAGSYSGTRYAAPFAILDSVYTIVKKIQTERPAISFVPLKLNWSINNVGTSGDKTIGQISTSHYSPSSNQIFILGKADADTDEYDNHVIVHEWGHFFENNLSRSDSPGGNHGTGDEKEISLAFGEGFGNAISAMAFDPDVYYADTSGSRQQSGFRMSLESSTDTNKGWFSETSIQEILYDIYDSVSEASDNLSLGIGPILDVLIGHQKTITAATSIFSFINGLKLADPTLSNDLNILLADKNIAAVTDDYGSAETNTGGWNNNLPVYNALTLGGAAVSLSLYGNFGANSFYGLYNSIFNNKYLKFTATTTTTRLVVTSTDTFGIDVYKKGVLKASETEDRTSAAAFGPFTYNLTTVIGHEYLVIIWTDQSAVFANAIINLTVTGTGI